MTAMLPRDVEPLAQAPDRPSIELFARLGNGDTIAQLLARAGVGYAEAGQAARHNVAFFDITFSVAKSVTLLHTAFEAQEVAVRTAGTP